MPPESEADLQGQAIQLAQLSGWLCHHTRAARTKDGDWRTPIQGDKGFPDVVFAHRSGRVLFAEFKSQKGRLAPEQAMWRDALDNDDQTDYRLWRPSDWPEIEATLTRGNP